MSPNVLRMLKARKLAEVQHRATAQTTRHVRSQHVLHCDQPEG